MKDSYYFFKMSLANSLTSKKFIRVHWISFVKKRVQLIFRAPFGEIKNLNLLWLHFSVSLICRNYFPHSWVAAPNLFSILSLYIIKYEPNFLFCFVLFYTALQVGGEIGVSHVGVK